MRAKVLSILGTRPEVIKLAPVIRAVEAHARLQSVVCATGQHREMLDLALDVFDIQPDFDLDLMQPGQQLSDLTARVVQSVTQTLREVRPDFLLVQGDTTTPMAAALASFYEEIPVGHVEAGLRTGDLRNPFPEEMNRRVIATLTTLHFAPTAGARAALLREGVPDSTIFVTGNTVIDALQQTVASEPDYVPNPGQRILVTAHRRESFGPGFEALCLGLRLVALRNPDIELLYPVHLNPQVREPVSRLLGDLPNVRLVDPLDYRTFVRAMRDATLIITDSGGVQEEAPSLGKPILVMRETTERPEGVDAGGAILVGTDPRRIMVECERLLHDRAAYARMAPVDNPFGDGHAGARIASAVAHWLGGDPAEIRLGETRSA